MRLLGFCFRLGPDTEGVTLVLAGLQGGAGVHDLLLDHGRCGVGLERDGVVITRGVAADEIQLGGGKRRIVAQVLAEKNPPGCLDERTRRGPGD